MTQKSKRISWVYTVLLFHAAVPDRTPSSKIVTGVQATWKASLESKTDPTGWFQQWTVNSGHVVPGEYATVPGAFKYSAIIEVDKLRCSAAVIASRWVLSSTHCFSTKSGTKQVSSKTISSEGGLVKIQTDVASNAKPAGFAYAGGIKYKAEADKDAAGVQRQRLERLFLYTESQTETDLRLHDIMLAEVGPLGFRFTQFVQPIRFTDQRRFFLAKPTTCVVVGYGDDNFETITLASLLQACSDKAEDEADNAVCVDQIRWPCMGDAGAPLVCQNMLVGTLRSEGLLPNDRCVKSATHTAKNFTFVGYYRDWIVEHAAVKFGMWRSGSTGYSSLVSGRRGASYTVIVLLDYYMYMYLK